jgi:hypothetical protein
VIECNDACPCAEKRAETVEIEASFGSELADAEAGATVQRELLPRDEIGVMIEGGDDDLFTRDERFSEGARDEVDGLCRAAGEYQTIVIGDTEESGDALARSVVSLRRTYRQRVGAAVRVCVIALVKVPDRVEHARRLLRGGRGVQVVEIGIRGKERKIGATAHSGPPSAIVHASRGSVCSPLVPIGGPT